MNKKALTIILTSILAVAIIGGIVLGVIYYTRQSNNPVPQSASLSRTSPIGSATLPYVIHYDGVQVKALIHKPVGSEADALLVFHGTAIYDSRIVAAAATMLNNTEDVVKRKNLVIISVAYPEEGLLFGDNIKEAQAALLWTKNEASKELGIKIDKIYLFGHSQGGYLVTRLNTMYKTDGVIANGAGPIDLGYECKLDETAPLDLSIKGREATHNVCSILKNKYGSAITNPSPYSDRSLMNFTSGYKSKILFIQGMNDKQTQMAEYPEFKSQINKCTDCAPVQLLEIPGYGHDAAFQSPEAIDAINKFLAD